MNYYNEWDSFAADWLKELIKDGLIPYGEVDSRSIADVEPSDLKGFTQCHFFAGIGGWSRALQLAGWSADRPVWTGSPPCQSFSAAGNQSGKEDLRHLWPVFFNLIRERRPSEIFGEQVANAIRFGWLDDLYSDLEASNYASAAFVLPSCAIKSPHKRSRLFFVAYSCDKRLQGHRRFEQESVQKDKENRPIRSASSKRQREERHSAEDSFWGTHTAKFSDGKTRAIPTQPALFPLANGLPNRMGILRGAGNAIVPQAAAEIIKAYMSCYR
jgi:DNA (cytosine-5)-methyltransferase 1